MIRSYGKTKDVTMTTKPIGVGIGFTRICFSCNRKRPELGGKTDKRTKMWRCAECAQPKEAT